MQFIDTAGAGYDEEREPDGESRLNPARGSAGGPQGAGLLEAGVPAARTLR